MFDYSDAWFLNALIQLKRLSTLSEIISIGDVLNHAILTQAEIDNALKKLVPLNYIQIDKDKYIATEKAIMLANCSAYKRAGFFTTTDIILKKLIGVSMKNFKEAQEQLLPKMQNDIIAFLSEHSEEKFYCFAFDCNAEYAQILLCLNTEKDFQKTLTRYQSGNSKQYYQTEEDIFSLRYNTGDWEYQGFASYTVFDEKKLTMLYSDDYELLQSEMMKFNYKLLERLCHTEAFNSVSKTEDFTVLCIDHDEDPDDAVKNTKEHVKWRR